MLWQYGSVILTAAIVGLSLRRPRIILYSPLFLFLIYTDIIISLQTIASTIRSQYRTIRTGSGTVEGSVWVSPERREVA